MRLPLPASRTGEAVQAFCFTDEGDRRGWDPTGRRPTQGGTSPTAFKRHVCEIRASVQNDKGEARSTFGSARSWTVKRRWMRPRRTPGINERLVRKIMADG